MYENFGYKWPMVVAGGGPGISVKPAFQGIIQIKPGKCPWTLLWKPGKLPWIFVPRVVNVVCVCGGISRDGLGVGDMLTHTFFFTHLFSRGRGLAPQFAIICYVHSKLTPTSVLSNLLRLTFICCVADVRGKHWIYTSHRRLPRMHPQSCF